MPIKIPASLPASEILENEGVLIIKETDAIRQDIRPLHIALLNLMPEKIKTETQIARVLGNSPLQIEMTLIAPTNYVPKNTPREHVLDFYHPFEEMVEQRFDGLIVTGAPIEQMPFEAVSYWDELCRIFDWSLEHVHGLFNLCWGGQAALYHFYRIPKYQMPAKRFGIYTHRVVDHTSLLMRGLNDEIPIPVSRHTENHRDDFAAFEYLEILIDSEEAGPCLVHDRKLRHVHMFNHLEYDSHTLDDEFKRDVAKGDAIDPPVNYYPGGDPNAEPVNVWCGNAHLLFGNWLNYLYQSTPFDLARVGIDPPREFHAGKPRTRPGQKVGDDRRTPTKGGATAASI